MIDTTYSLDELNAGSKRTLSEAIGLEFTSISEQHLEARIPVDNRTIQPIGILNGGASAALAETVGSFASYLSIDRSTFYTVGLEIKCNHIRSAFSGYVYGKATAVHIGKQTQVWSVHIRDESEKLVCLSTLTMQVQRLDANPGAMSMLANSALSAFK